MKNKIGIISLVLSLSVTAFCCNSSVKSEGHATVQDSIKRPANISPNASLINPGEPEGEGMPVYQWVEYAGKLVYDGKEHSHIYGFKYFNDKGSLLSTVYYENMEIRGGKKDFDASKSKVLLYPGDATIQLSNEADTLLFFHVLESDEFKRTYQGLAYTRMPAVYFETNYDTGFRSADDVEFNIDTEGGKYFVTFTGTTVPFKLSSSCNGEPGKVSFLNYKEGRIYFIEKECYLELVNSEDIQKIQALRR
jgi:hypothetical protein